MKSICAFSLFYCCCCAIFSQNPNCLDPAFGTGGVLKFEPGANYEVGNGIAFQADGKVLVCAEAEFGGLRVQLRRFHPDGSIDTTFGAKGTVVVSADDEVELAGDVIVLPNGKIAASVGHFSDLHKIYLFHPDGSPDLSFGQNGVYSIPGASVYDAYNAWLSLLPDGKFVAYNNGYEKLTLVRFNADGSLDATFGTGGVAVTNFPEYPFDVLLVKALETAADGSVFVGGRLLDNNDSPFFLMKFKPNGSLDNAFGNNGRIVQFYLQSTNSEIQDIQLLPDGSIVAIGKATTNTKTDFFLSKYQSNGAVFSSFGQNGSTQETFATRQVAFNDLMPLPNGNLLVSGRIGTDMAFMQYTPAGQRLGSYANNGTLKINFGPVGSNECRQLALHPTNAKIYAVGYTVCSIPEDVEYLDRNDADIAIVRLNADGALDTGFGDGGRAKSFVNNPANEAKALALQGDGKFITVSSSHSFYGATLMRFFPDGRPDRSFGNFGKVHVGLIVSEEGCIKINNGPILLTGRSANNLVLWRLLNDGSPDLGFGTKGLAKLADFYTEGHAVETSGNKILVSGCANCLSDEQFLVAQFNDNGTLDAGFGTAGKTIVPFSTGRDIGKFLKVRSNGKIVVVGQTQVNFTAYPAILQLNPNGALDAGFGTNGKVTVNAPGKQGFVSGVELLPDGKIVLTNDTDLFAAQFLGNGALDPSFSQNGWIDRFEDMRHSFPAYSNTLATLGGRVYYGGNTSNPPGLTNAVMIARSAPNGAVTSPCGIPSTVFYADLFAGYSEEIQVLKADSDHSMLVFGEYVSDPGISGNTHLFLTRFVPGPPVALYPVPSLVNVTPSGSTINSFLVAGECESWIITEDSPWILSVGPNSGSGAVLKNVYVYCSQNPGTTPRTATLNLSGCGASNTVTVVQAGVALTASPLSFSVGSGGGASLLEVIGTCNNWTITETASWISVAPSSGSQNKQVTINYDPNPNSNARSAILRLEGCGVTLNLSFGQAGTSLNFSATALSVEATAGTRSVGVTGACAAWALSVDSAWLSVSPTQGSQSQTVTLTYAKNPRATSRTAKVTAKGCNTTKTLTVTQEGATLSVSTSTLTVKALPGSETFNVSGTCGNWTVGSNVPWLSVSPDVGGDPAKITVQIEANLSPDARAGTVIVSGCGILHTIAIEQEGALLAINNSILLVESPQGEFVFNVVGTCANWTISSDVPWLSVSPASGAGVSGVVLQVEDNPNTLGRDGKLTVSGCGLTRTITVIQWGASPVLSASPSAFAVGSAQGTEICSVDGNCEAWTLVSNAAWLHLGATSGNGPASVSIGFDNNPGTTLRSGTLTLSGCGLTRTIVVSQSGKPLAAFTATQTQGCAPLTVHFDNLSANADSFLWTFPGGVPSASTEKHPTVFYEKAGKYSVSLLAKRATAEATEAKQDFVHAIKPPPKDFTTSTIPNSSTVQFFTPPRAGVSFFWDFGDGHTATATNPSHTYASGGTYTVAMKANNGCLTEKTKNIDVPPPPSTDDRSSTSPMGKDGGQTQALEFSVTPNPTPDGQVSVRFGASGKVRFELVDTAGKIIGRQVSAFSPGQLEQKISFSGLLPGIYLLRASDGQKSGVRRIAVVR